MTAIVNTFVLCYAALFPIVNPVGSAPLFLGLTQFATDRSRNTLAGRVAVGSFFLLLGSLFMGSHVLEFFGISLPVVRIGGGLVVTAFGWKLLNSDADPDTTHSTENAPSAAPDSFYPLTMPLTVGPGSISVAMSLGSQRPKAGGLPALGQFGCGAIAAILAIVATVYVCYRFAESIVAALGKSGTNVLVRLSAFIMLCIGIQIIWSGWKDLGPPLH